MVLSSDGSVIRNLQRKAGVTAEQRLTICPGCSGTRGQTGMWLNAFASQTQVAPIT